MDVETVTIAGIECTLIDPAEYNRMWVRLHKRSVAKVKSFVLDDLGFPNWRENGTVFVADHPGLRDWLAHQVVA